MEDIFILPYRMLQNVIKNYYTFFDETIQSSTMVVLMITLLICMLGVNQSSAGYMKGSILENQHMAQEKNIIYISGKKYEVSFTELK